MKKERQTRRTPVFRGCDRLWQYLFGGRSDTERFRRDAFCLFKCGAHSTVGMVGRNDWKRVSLSLAGDETVAEEWEQRKAYPESSLSCELCPRPWDL